MARLTGKPFDAQYWTALFDGLEVLPDVWSNVETLQNVLCEMPISKLENRSVKERKRFFEDRQSEQSRRRF
eukprot:scaffold2329_cov161-Amphora_coffeaeformis.AAC.2